MRFIALIFVLLLTVSGVSSQDDTPYIYYYDTLQNGLVIERADGTDSRIISDVPNVEPIWSPSGKWMLIGPTILSTDGKTRINTFSNDLDPNAYQQLALWSPHDDILLITSMYLGYQKSRIQLLDVEQNQVLVDTEVSFYPLDPPTAYRLHWAANGEQAYIWGGDFLLTVYLDGHTRFEVGIRYAPYHFPFVFEEGKFLHYGAVEDRHSAIVAEDLETDQIIELDDLQQRIGPGFSMWSSPAGNYAVIYAYPCENDRCDGWMKILNWSTGTLIDLQTETEAQLHTCVSLYQCKETWSPQGNFALMVDENGLFHVLNAATGETHQVGVDPGSFRWMPDERLLIFDYAKPHNLLYDPLTGQTTKITLPTGMNLYESSPSPDGHYLALRTAPATIVDFDGHIIAQAAPHSHSTYSYEFPAYGYRWHPELPWIFADYNVFFAGGGIGPRATMLFNLEGTIRHEFPTGGATGFVPERAIAYLTPGQETTLLKEPDFILPHVGRYIAVGWHPTDPNQLVTYSDEDGLTFWSLASGEVVIIDQIVPTTQYPIHPVAGLKLFWLPQENTVAFYAYELRQIDPDTGEIVPVLDVAYPILENVDDGFVIHNSVTDEVVNLDTDAQFGKHRALTSTRDALIVSGEGYDDFVFYITDMGKITQLDQTGNQWVTDANHDTGIVAFGSVYWGQITLISTETGKILDQFHHSANSLAFSADGRWLATTSRGMTAIWDMAEYIED